MACFRRASRRLSCAAAGLSMYFLSCAALDTCAQLLPAAFAAVRVARFGRKQCFCKPGPHAVIPPPPPPPHPVQILEYSGEEHGAHEHAGYLMWEMSCVLPICSPRKPSAIPILRSGADGLRFTSLWTKETFVKSVSQFTSRFAVEPAADISEVCVDKEHQSPLHEFATQ